MPTLTRLISCVPSASITDRTRLDEANLFASPATASDDRRPVAPPGPANSLGEDVENALAHVVPGVLILRTRVAQSHDHLAGAPALGVGHAVLAPLLVRLLGLLRTRGPRRLLALVGSRFLFLRLALGEDFRLGDRRRCRRRRRYHFLRHRRSHGRDRLPRIVHDPHAFGRAEL